MSSKHLILCRPLLLLPSIFPSISVFSNESVLRIRWPKYWSFSFNITPSSEHPGLISFRMDWLDLLAVHGLSITYSYNISYVQLNKINPFSLETPILQAVPGHCPPLPQAGISHAQGEADTPSLVPQSSSLVMLPRQWISAHAHLQPSHHLWHACCVPRLC